MLVVWVVVVWVDVVTVDVVDVVWVDVVTDDVVDTVVVVVDDVVATLLQLSREFKEFDNVLSLSKCDLCDASKVVNLLTIWLIVFAWRRVRDFGCCSSTWKYFHLLGWWKTPALSYSWNYCILKDKYNKIIHKVILKVAWNLTKKLLHCELFEQ